MSSAQEQLVDDSSVEPAKRARARQSFRALSHPSFRLFIGGAFLSNIGTWMQAVAQGWLVFHLTNSAFWLGVDGFMASTPGMVLTLAAGVFADRADRRRILIITQMAAGLSAFTLAVLIVLGFVSGKGDVWMVLLLTFATGCCMAIASPAYHAIVIEMVGPEDLPNAIALNSTQFQLSRVVGPSLAGVAFQVFGVAGCFFANATSFVAVVFALWRAQIVSSREPQPKISLRRDRAILWSELREGLDYVRSRPRVFMLLVICAISTLFGAPYITMIPYFAKEVHHLGETGLSVMMGTAGAGAFLGALTLVMMGNSARKGSAVLAGAFVYGVGITGFSLSQSLGVSLAFLFVLGFAIVFTVAVTNMLLQKLVTDKMRGRVLSMFVLTFFGPMPISNLVAGSLASRFGAAHTLAVGGLIITLFVLIVTVTNKRLRELS